MFETPILYLIFNRPDLTEVTFSSICTIKPKKLFIAADGPRSGNEYDELIAITGRALQNADDRLRYVTVRMNDTTTKLVYGMDRVDKDRKVYIVEGQIDSLFLPNAIASGDSALGATSNLFQAKQKVLVFDNEPRNKEIVKLMQNAITSDHDIVIWPDNVVGKDINEMVMRGMDPLEIKDIIDSNTINGLAAQLKFNYWKKV